MQFHPCLTFASISPTRWAQAREAEGWAGIGVSDHLWILDEAAPHLWATVAEVALATTRMTIVSSFANNLVRSPVEFAQGALSIQRASGGRFEAGLGAGWNREEIERSGRRYPSAPDRAGMYQEAVWIVRELFRRGNCRFEGDFYAVDVPVIGPACVDPPPLVVSVGGPRTIREVAPLADHVEIKANAAATRGGGRGGGNDLEILATVTRTDLQDLVGRVREVNPTAPLGLFAMVGVGDHPAVRNRERLLGDGLFGRMVGQVDKVADHLLSLEELGISRVHFTELVPGTFEALADRLLSGRL